MRSTARRFGLLRLGVVLPLPGVAVVAPAIGLLLDVVIMRRLAGASTIAGIVATIGLLFALVQIAGILWPQDQSYSLPGFLPGESFELLQVNVTYHRGLSLLIAIAVAFGLRFLLYNTRLGTAMRPCIDDMLIMRPQPRCFMPRMVRRMV